MSLEMQKNLQDRLNREGKSKSNKKREIVIAVFVILWVVVIAAISVYLIFFAKPTPGKRWKQELEHGDSRTLG